MQIPVYFFEKISINKVFDVQNIVIKVVGGHLVAVGDRNLMVTPSRRKLGILNC